MTMQVKDPTENVMKLVEAATRRLDDLRLAEAHRVDQRMDLEREHIKDLMTLRSAHAEDLRVAESKRIDANRAGDMQAVTVANERAIAQASVLARQLAESVDTLRALIGTTAKTIEDQLDQFTSQMTSRLAALESARSESKGTGSGMERMWVWVFGGLLGLVAIAGLVINALRVK